MPLNLLTLGLLFVAAIVLVTLIQVGAISIAFDKLGLSPGAGFLLLVGSLLGSGINIPLYFRDRRQAADDESPADAASWGWSGQVEPGKTLVAVNVGGCLIPVAVSLYLWGQQPLRPVDVLLALTAVTAASYAFSRPVRGLGIGMPLFVAPTVSALTAWLLDPTHAAPLAYISGTLGVLTGADLLRLRDIDRLHTAVASIGGAGTFDGIFFTGIIAALLA